MNPVELPAFHYFQVGNKYSGHVAGEKRYLISSDKQQQMLMVQVWMGPFCLEKSEVLDSADFPLEEHGYEQLLNWLNSME